MLIEVNKIINRASRAHHCKAWMVRENVAEKQSVRNARAQVMRDMRQAGIPIEDIASFLNCDNIQEAERACRKVIPEQNYAQPAKFCNICGDVKHINEFPRNRRSSDGRQSHCRICQRVVDRDYRERKARRPGGVQRHKTSLEIDTNLKAVLEDTANRHKITMSAILERAVAKAMACTNCKKHLRQIGGDDCFYCRKEWSPEVAA